uniref:Uncharacterized protein n=1 Tax=Anguilla anguilla TaxID=7936 RepID=A0A0E9XSV3_ANGAN
MLAQVTPVWPSDLFIFILY